MTSPGDNPGTAWIKTVVLIVIVAVVAAAYFLVGDELTLQSLAKREGDLRDYQERFPWTSVVIAFVIYVIATGLSLPGAAVLSLAYGWYFGFWIGFILISMASTLGATIAFLMSRYLLKDWFESKFGDKLTDFNDNLRREGAFYLFTLRLIPVVPFFVINVVMGLTHIKTTTFWWVSQLGMLAGTAIYVNAGSSFPSLSALAEDGAGGILTPKLFLSLVALGVFPMIAKKVFSVIRGNENRDIENPSAT